MEEILDVVDENNKVIGQAPKDECYKKGLIFRSVSILVKNSNGEILITRRSLNKPRHPGLFSISAAGHVPHGESYEQAAKRELEEEIGIVSDIKLLDNFFISLKYPGEIAKSFTSLFECQWDKELKFKDREVIEAKFLSPDVLKKMLKENTNEFNPASVVELNHYFEYCKNE